MEMAAKRYLRRWRGGTYQKLEDETTLSFWSVRKRVRRIKFGSAPTGKRRRSWRMKVVPKLRLLKKASPRKFLVWLREKYMSAMLRFANSPVFYSGAGTTVGAFPFGRRPTGRQAQSKEYDNKVLMKMYKSMLMKQGNMVQDDAARLGGIQEQTSCEKFV